jgi:uncharacterized membrane protein YjjP (DUF1212 family)
MAQEPETVGSTSLEDIAMLSMEFGRLLMECGARAQVVDEIVHAVARGLGAERADLRIGYASLAITVGFGGEWTTRMRKVGPLGVNQRLDYAVCELAESVDRGELTAAAARSRLEALAQNPPRYPGWLVDLAVGMACASFGRLLGIDWAAAGPVFLAVTVGQWLRRQSAARHVNVFLAATLVAFVGSALSGLGASLLQSVAVGTAMIASVLLLVPGVPALNAQNDILEGHPTLGSARAVWVGVILVFITLGIWLGQVLLGLWHLAGDGIPLGASRAHFLPYLLHQTSFGALAAVGFGVMFNIRGSALVGCAAAGALALAVRSTGQSLDWTLEGASFAAALAVGIAVRLSHAWIGVSRNTMAVAGCVPMIPGGFAARAILGLFALTRPAVQNPDQTLMVSVQDALRVAFTIGAMGTGLAIPSMLLRVRRPSNPEPATRAPSRFKPLPAPEGR